MNGLAIVVIFGGVVFLGAVLIGKINRVIQGEIDVGLQQNRLEQREIMVRIFEEENKKFLDYFDNLQILLEQGNLEVIRTYLDQTCMDYLNLLEVFKLGFPEYVGAVIQKMHMTEVDFLDFKFDIRTDLKGFAHFRGRSLVLGPLIGVFVSPYEIKKISEGRVSTKISIPIGRLVKIYMQYAVSLVLTTLYGSKWEQMLVRAWTYKGGDSEGNGWVPKVFPLPKVVYDRCFGMENRKKGILLRKRYNDIPGTTIFNAMPKLKKWETYQVLGRNPALRP